MVGAVCRQKRKGSDRVGCEGHPESDRRIEEPTADEAQAQFGEVGFGQVDQVSQESEEGLGSWVDRRTPDCVKGEEVHQRGPIAVFDWQAVERVIGNAKGVLEKFHERVSETKRRFARVPNMLEQVGQIEAE